MFVWNVCLLALMQICMLAPATLAQVSSSCSVSTEICTNVTSVQDEIVNQHNAFRRAVSPSASNMLKMNWSQEAAVSAQNWANTCSMVHGEPSTRMLGTYQMGENLFKSTGMVKWTSVVTAWHNEVANYVYPTGSANTQPIGHYTQVVWYSSYSVGCGAAKCGSNYFYVCHYFRAGNFKGVAPYTQGQSCAACPGACEDKLCTNPCPHINKYSNCASLVAALKCTYPGMTDWCPASCLCSGKIIPVGK